MQLINIKCNLSTEIKAVFFDVDDTLYDHSYHIHQAMTAVREEFSFLQEFSIEYLKGLSHKFLEEVHERLLRGEITVEESRKIRWQKFIEVTRKPKMDAMKLANFYSTSYYKNERAVPGAIELLQILKGSYTIGIISNNLLDEQLNKMRRIGIVEHIDTFAISEEVGVAKPDPKIFEVALERAGVTADEAILIGDSWNNDVLGALQVGIRPIWFNRNETESLDSGITEISSFTPARNVLGYIRNESPTPHNTRVVPANV
jgi:HAD superfamily hydrolase (TIGR01549 family)